MNTVNILWKNKEPWDPSQTRILGKTDLHVNREYCCPWLRNPRGTQSNNPQQQLGYDTEIEE